MWITVLDKQFLTEYVCYIHSTDMIKPFKFFPSKGDENQIEYLYLKTGCSDPHNLVRLLLGQAFTNWKELDLKHRVKSSDRLQAREERIQWIRNSSNKEFTAWLKEIEYLPPDELQFNTSAQHGKYYFYDTDAQGKRHYVCEIRHVETGKTSMFDKIEDIDATIRKLIKKKLI